MNTTTVHLLRWTIYPWVTSLVGALPPKSVQKTSPGILLNSFYKLYLYYTNLASCIGTSSRRYVASPLPKLSTCIDPPHQNILIASDSPLRIKLADFGLAVKTTGAQLDEREASSWCVGTPDWASPEQKDCFIGPYTGKTDMWSAGCISHYVLTSHIPFLDRDAGNGPGVVEKYNYPSWPRVRREEFYNKVEHSIYDPIVVRGASSAANEFLNCLIVFNPDLRMSALNALSHRWINPTGMDPVELALIRGSEPLVDLFIRGGSPNPSPSRRLLVAAEKGRTEIVRRLLREVVYSRHEPGLQEACELGLQGCHSAVVDELWPHLSMYQRTCMTELHEKIAMFGTPKFLKKVIRYLKDNTQLRQGLNDSVIEVCAYDILFAEMMKAAARHGNIINLKILIKSSPHQEIPGGALLEAAKGGHLKVVKWILGCYRWVFADIGDPGGSLHGNIFSQALTYASSGGHMDVVKYFVPRRIAPNQRAIDKAVANNHTAIFQYFVNALRDIYKLSPEMGFKYIKTEAVGYCDLNTLKWCPNPSSLNENLKTHVGCASRLGHLDVVEWLLEEVPPIGINRAEEMHEGLIEASGAGHIDIVKFLCDKIGCVRIEIPLERAAAGGHVEVLEQLLSRRDKESSLSPALRAAQSSNQFVVLLKLDNLKT